MLALELYTVMCDHAVTIFPLIWQTVLSKALYFYTHIGSSLASVSVEDTLTCE